MEKFIKKESIVNASQSKLQKYGFEDAGLMQEYLMRNHENDKIVSNSSSPVSMDLNKNRLFVSKKNGLKKQIESLEGDIQNSSLVVGGGLAPLISQLAVATGMVFEQTIYTTEKDENNNSIPVEDYIPTIKASNYSYSEAIYYKKQARVFDLTPESLSNGFSEKPGQVGQTSGEANDIKIAYETQPIWYYTAEHSFNEIQAQAAKKIGYDQIAESMQAIVGRFSQRMYYAKLVGMSNLGTQGLLSIDASVDVPSTDQFAIDLGLTKLIHTMSFVELQKLANGMKELARNRRFGYAGSWQKPTLAVPAIDFIRMSTQPYNTLFVDASITAGVTGMTYLSYLKTVTGFDIKPLSLAEKGHLFNPTTGGTPADLYTFYDNSSDVLMQADVQDISLYAGTHTTNGVDFKGVFTSQVVLPFAINKNHIVRISII